MRIGFHLTPFWSLATRNATELIDDDCVDALARATAMGLDGIGFTMYSLPKDVQARIDYLQMVAEQILRPVGATPP